MTTNTDNFKVSTVSGNLHEGAARGRRMGQWGTRRTSPTGEVVGDLATLRDRLRTLRRDNAWTARANAVDVVNVIGTGIKPVPNTPSRELNDTIAQAWDDWVDDADFMRGGLSIYAIQAMMQSAKKESGEAFLITRNLRIDRADKMVVPIQFQLLESDYCPLELTKYLGENREIISGVEVDSFGRIIARYFYKKHPNSYRLLGNSIHNPDQFIRIPQQNVIAYFDQERPNQLRGRPKASNSIVTARTFDVYNDAELTRKESRAALTGTIERPAYDERDYIYDPMTGKPFDPDHNDIPIINLETGTFQSLLAGEKLNLFESNDAGLGFKDYQSFQLLQISASHGIPYQLLSGDWSTINDRVWRAIFNAYKREVQHIQELSFIPKVCTPIYKAFVERGIVSGLFDVGDLKPREYLRCTHRTQAWEHVHPEQDVNAFIKKLKAGVATRKEYIATQGSSGSTVELIDAERAQDKEREESLGLKSLANYESLDTPQPQTDNTNIGGNTNGN